jgi:DNA polymerase-3 subunit chi
MPQVDFYILDRGADDARLTVACRIAEKAMLGDMRVFVRASSAGEATRLDDLLWTFSQGSFVPHRLAGAEPGDNLEPVVIGVDDPSPALRFDVLINLATDMPADVARYSRIAELIDADEGRRALGRERFRRYREQGCKLDSHNL